MSELTNQASKSEGVSLENKMYRLPEQKTLENACKLSLTEDKPIMMDYWASSIDNTSIIGVQEDDNSVFELQGYKNIIISPQVKSQIIVF